MQNKTFLNNGNNNNKKRAFKVGKQKVKKKKKCNLKASDTRRKEGEKIMTRNPRKRYRVDPEPTDGRIQPATISRPRENGTERDGGILRAVLTEQQSLIVQHSSTVNLASNLGGHLEVRTPLIVIRNSIGSSFAFLSFAGVPFRVGFVTLRKLVVKRRPTLGRASFNIRPAQPPLGLAVGSAVLAEKGRGIRRDSPRLAANR